MVNVIGLGYIGLPTALMMASHGVEVIGTDYNKRHLATGLKVYDPFITKDVVKNQYHDLDAFLADVDTSPW